MRTANVIIRVDETIDHHRRMAIAGTVRAHPGVTEVAHHDDKPHLMSVNYDPMVVTAQVLLGVVYDEGVHAEFVGS